ncbi:hypothetical protein SAMN05443507_1014 [Alicyclobacillus tolerans]|uniref:Uncharacterized protein n=1 Tax=Alicyclobacillus tolerans TaxID=90970 RepID=A0A1M6JNH0_9BACL|nr:hypothetical protein SAMN05443507_1014 [Alicyclobacillus montanus]
MDVARAYRQAQEYLRLPGPYPSLAEDEPGFTPVSLRDMQLGASSEIVRVFLKNQWFYEYSTSYSQSNLMQ